MDRKADQTALTIAGFDPSSGAGITADLQVFAAHGIFGISAISALTVQSTLGVRRTEPVAPQLLRDTLETLHADISPDGIKIGMLGGVQQVKEVVRYLRNLAEKRPAVVLDPVIRSSSGALLLEESGLAVLREELLPIVDAVTPNVAELALLTNRELRTEEDIRKAAELLQQRAGCAIIVTGGDLEKPDDRILNQGIWTVLSGERIETTATHGTGCAFSSAMLCGLLHGVKMEDAAYAAKSYVAEAMRSATPRGRGRGPMNLLWPVLRHKEG